MMNCAEKELDLSMPRVMGILNVTPDSFSDGGDFYSLDKALWRAEEMVQEGASIIDVGGESTRPGAASVTEQEELDRVIPVIEKISGALDVIISVDTSKAVVMREAASAGAGIINDVMALTQDGTLDAARELELPVCLMHMRGTPRTMQSNPYYRDVVTEVMHFLLERIKVCEEHGIRSDSIIVDPGIGFGKTLHHNVKLVEFLDSFKSLNVPVLLGVSRKSFLGQITGKDVSGRLAGSLAVAALAIIKGVSILRVHDVGATLDVIKTIHYIQNGTLTS